MNQLNKQALMDSDFLKKLDSFRHRIIFAKLISLDFNENPIEEIEGRVTGGSINIDGASALRRTCSVSMIAKEMNINDFYWGLSSKFKLEIGLQNLIDNKYPDIIWFPQGIFVITSFNTNQSTSNYTISIQGKDKMCLLNGDVGGNLPASIDFGVEEFYDTTSGVITYNKIPIKTIIKEALHTYAKEPYYNIIVEDLEEAGLELLEYRGEDPLYLLYDIADGDYENGVLNAEMPCQIVGGSLSTIGKLEKYFSRVDLIEDNATKITFPSSKDPNKQYYVAKLEFGQTAGYHISELVYPGDLISSIGETVTSILDKIKNMLGEFEYFYDLEGRFIFRRKKVYVQSIKNNIINTEDDRYVENSAYNYQTIYNFEGGNLITSYQNTPNLSNVKNDYSIWGNRKSISGAEIPIHYRYAIDIKPTSYKSIEVNESDIPGYLQRAGVKPQKSVLYTTEDWDWRELIYQMALDYYQYNRLEDFLQRVTIANPTFINGKTGYEQYYIDIQGFWRDLYYPNAVSSFFPYSENNLIQGYPTFTLNRDEYPKGLFIKEGYKKYNTLTEEDQKKQRKNVYVLQQNTIIKPNRLELQPLLNSIKLDFKFKDGKQTDLNKRYVITHENGYLEITEDILPRISKNEIFSYDLITKKALPLIEAEKPTDKWYIKISYEDNISLEEYLNSNSDLQLLYLTGNENEYYNYIQYSELNIYGDYVPEGKIIKTYLKYHFEENEYYQEENAQYKYWNKKITNSPDSLNFWFDFLDTEGDLSQYSIPVIGDRTKVVNDKDVKSIYFRQVPEIIYIRSDDKTTNNNEYEDDYGLIDSANYWHYTRIQSLPVEYFNISAQGKSAQDVVEEFLYNYSYCTESITLTTIPIYYLEPNSRILVKDDSSKINGEYLISRISIPLTYNGTMTITATKAPTRLF